MLRATTTTITDVSSSAIGNTEINDHVLKRYVTETIQHGKVIFECVKRFKNSSFDVFMKFVTAGLPYIAIRTCAFEFYVSACSKVRNNRICIFDLYFSVIVCKYV